jgi:uncharacterized membrane-anchored protein YjiN (DUF445 family)
VQIIGVASPFPTTPVVKTMEKYFPELFSSLIQDHVGVQLQHVRLHETVRFLQ